MLDTRPLPAVALAAALAIVWAAYDLHLDGWERAYD
jgi:hypothetical protein